MTRKKTDNEEIWEKVKERPGSKDNSMMTREERRLTMKKYRRKLKKDQVLKITAVTVMHETCMSISVYASV